MVYLGIILAALIGIGIGFSLGFLVKKQQVINAEKNGQNEAKNIVEKAKEEAEALKNNAIREGKEEVNNLKNEAERDIKERKVLLLN